MISEQWDRVTVFRAYTSRSTVADAARIGAPAWTVRRLLAHRETAARRSAAAGCFSRGQVIPVADRAVSSTS